MVKVYIPTLPYPIRTRDVVRTIEKLKKKGYNYDEITIVVPSAEDGYYVIEYSASGGQWGWEHVAVDPIVAQAHNIINARGASGYLNDLAEVAEFINENAEFDA